MYWAQFTLESELYTIAKTDAGLCFLGNDFENKEAFLQWASRKKWADLQYDEQQFTEERHLLQQYFQGGTAIFKLSLDLSGTAFQQQVWAVLQRIPYGETVSYSNVAEQLGRKEAVRAVANAIGANPVLVIVPCHRVLGKNGKLTGFRGGLDLKQQLLHIEGHKADYA